MIYTTGGTVLSIDSSRHTVRALVSSGEVVRGTRAITLNSAFDKRLQAYRDNPVLLWCHPEAESPEVAPWTVIGRALTIETTPDGLVCEFQYAVEENEQAALVWRLVEGGYLRAFSIGFMPFATVKRSSSEAEKAALPDYARAALESGVAEMVNTDVELWEVSQVWIGADRKALAQAPSLKGGLDDVKTQDAQAPTAAPTVQMPVQMLDLAARLHNIGCALECSEWYDWTPEKQLETLTQSVTVLQAVLVDVKAMADAKAAEIAPEPAAPAPEPPEEEPPVEIELEMDDQVPRGVVVQAGKTLSAATRQAIEDALACHKDGVSKMQALLDSTVPEDDAEEQSPATDPAVDWMRAVLGD